MKPVLLALTFLSEEHRAQMAEVFEVLYAADAASAAAAIAEHGPRVRVALTIGAIGFEGRRDYAAIGNVTNLAARLCAEAQGGQILVSSVVAAHIAHRVPVNSIGALSLKGFAEPVPCHEVATPSPNHAAGQGERKPLSTPELPMQGCRT